MASELLLFFREFLRAPKRVGSVAPSARQLADRMVRAADIHDGHVVVELGAGTGPVTRALRRAHPGNPLMVLEPGAELAAKLRVEFPDVCVLEEFAQDLPRLCAEWGHPEVDRVVSSLPWTMWEEAVIRAGLAAVTTSLRPTTGRMVTFSYAHAQLLLPGARRFRHLLRDYFEHIERTEVQWRNLPPALVFVCEGPRRRA